MIKYFIPIILLILVLVYLNRAYSYFYYTIGKVNLQSPFAKSVSYIVGKENGGKTLKYVALGDSLSAGVGSSDYTQTLPLILAQKLSQNSKEPVQIINLSQPGAKTSDLIQNQLDQALKENPNYVSLLIGINNIHDLWTVQRFSQDFDLIISQLKNTKGKIIVFNLPYLGSSKTVFFPFNLLLDYQTQQYNLAIAQICKNHHLTYIDLYTQTKSAFATDQNLYAQDFFHPSNQGYLYWGQIIQLK